jgi:hypothetical protein
MRKALIATITAAALAGTALTVVSYAQSPGTPDRPGSAVSTERGGPTANQLQAFADARIAALKAGLMLTPEQEKNWPAVENAMRDAAKRRAERILAWRAEREKQTGPVDAITRLRAISDILSERAADMKKFADASKPLYDSLDERQKYRFANLIRRGARHYARMAWHEGRERYGRERGWWRWRDHHDGDRPFWRRHYD